MNWSLPFNILYQLCWFAHNKSKMSVMRQKSQLLFLFVSSYLTLQKLCTCFMSWRFIFPVKFFLYFTVELFSTLNLWWNLSGALSRIQVAIIFILVFSSLESFWNKVFTQTDTATCTHTHIICIFLFLHI